MGPSRSPVPFRLAVLMVLMMSAAGAVFAVTTWQVAAHGPLRTVDERAGAALERHAPAAWLSQFLSDLGNLSVAIPVLVLAMACAVLRTRRWLPVLCCLAALAAVPAIVVPVKAWLERPGPHGGAGYYPSGHAATSAVAYGAAALLLVLARRHAPALRQGPALRSTASVAAPVTAVVLTAANGAGLMWHGYHWPLDVLASWCLGVLLLIGPALVCHRAAAGGGGRSPETPDRP